VHVIPVHGVDYWGNFAAELLKSWYAFEEL
jgi:hypothetical protein